MRNLMGRVAAAVGMIVCCSLTMAVALGALAFSSVAIVSGVAVAVGVGCAIFAMTATTLVARRKQTASG